MAPPVPTATHIEPDQAMALKEKELGAGRLSGLGVQVFPSGDVSNQAVPSATYRLPFGLPFGLPFQPRALAGYVEIGSVNDQT